VAGDRTRLRWAVALAALVGGAGGSFLGLTLWSWGLTPTGPDPILGGDAAFTVNFVLGVVAGTGVGALAAYLVGRSGRERAGALIGSASGLVGAATVVQASPTLAVDWINAFGGNPTEAGVVGGAIAGALAGVAVGAVLLVVTSQLPRTPRLPSFAALLGSVAGLVAGTAGGGLASALAEAASVCPNGPSSFPLQPPGECSVGVTTEMGVFVGAWAGAVAGAIFAGAVALVLRRWTRPTDLASEAGP